MSRKKIPADEMLLAEAIAAAKARGLKWTEGSWFRDDYGIETTRQDAAFCCALGALGVAGRVRIGHVPLSSKFGNVAYGNDTEIAWSSGPDRGESLGWAYRQAMQDGDS